MRVKITYLKEGPNVIMQASSQLAKIKRTPLDLPLLFFSLSAFIGLWAAYDRSLSWALLTTILGSAALYLALTWPGFGETALRRLAWVLLLCQLGFALYYITQFEHLGYPDKMGIVSRLGKLTGKPFPAVGNFRPQPNALATFIEGGLPLALGLALSARGRWERWAAGLTFLLLGYGLLLTASRGGWMAVAACAGLALVVGVGRRLAPERWLAGLLTLLALALVAAVGLALLGPERVPGLSSALSRGEDRGQLYVNSLHLLREYPLTGTGLGNTFAMVYSKYILLIRYAYLTYAHNLPIAVWMNQGLLGLLSFAWMLLTFCALVVRQARRGQGSVLFWGAVGGATVMLLHGLTDAPEYTDDRWVMPALYALLGLSVALARPFVERRPLKSRRLALLLVALGAVGVFLLLDDFYANLGALSHTRADLSPGLDDVQRQDALEQAERYCQRALDINAEQAAAHWRLGLM